MPLVRPGRFRFAPLTPGRRSLQVIVPSRTRVGVGTAVTLGVVDSNVATATIALPDLTTVVLGGRIELPSDVPTERIVVLATRRSERDDRARWWGRSVGMTGIDAGGRFTIDLPQGSYVLQLAALATGIVVHPEDEDTVASAAEVVLKPAVQWLTVVCEPTTAGAEVVVESVQVSLPAPRDDASAFLESWGGGRGRQQGRVSAAVLPATRWLVPRTTVEIKVLQSFDRLRVGSNAWQTQTVAETSVDIDAAGARVVLVVPDPPTDEQLGKRQ